MKKLLFLTAVGVILITPAIAVQKCVASLGDSGTTCSARFVGGGEVNWGADCTTNGIDVPVLGVAQCTGHHGKIGAEAESPILGFPDDDVYCWCRMIYPVVSYYWAYAEEEASAIDCNDLCGQRCADMMENSLFRKVLFTDLNYVEDYL